MGNGNELDNATERLAAALKAMEDAVASKRHSELTIESLEEQILSLKANLDAERQKNDKMSEAHEDASKRIDAMMDSLKDMLQGG